VKSFVNIIRIIEKNDELWDLFTQRTEYNSELLDMYSRIRFFSNRHRDVLKPMVSEQIFSRNEIEYPNNHKFAICLSHDIDTLYNDKIDTILHLGHALRHKNYKNAISHVKSATLGRFHYRWNNLWNFDKIIEIEKRYDAKSTFFLLATRKGADEHNYQIRELRSEVEEIVAKGWEVALHGSRAAHNNFNELELEVRHFEDSTGQKLSGYRNHGLHFKTPETWRYLEQVGMLYDASIGYPDMVGFRNGMCHPYYPYDLDKERFINVMEIPLVIMEGTLFDYMRLDYETAFRLTKRLIDLVSENRGVITILWHNDSLCSEIAPDRKSFYEHILNYGREKNAWMTSCESVYRFFSKHWSS
jgi:peptidoglycan/xylan/chitin deacetylase (PgdA/CDA1 family)